MERYETFIGFNPDKTAAFYYKRGWQVEQLPVSNISLVKVTNGAALECGDGRFDQLEGRGLVAKSKNEEEKEVRGVRILGGVNAVMSLLTGGDEVGLLRATDLLKRFRATPGTHSAEHGGCGYADLWMAGELESAKYPYQLHDVVGRGGERIGQRLKATMKDLGGKHFRLNGNHREEGVRLNPFIGYTEKAYDGSRFRVDDWFMADLGISDEARYFKIAEVIEKLKPDAAKLEIIVPIAHAA